MKKINEKWEARERAFDDRFKWLGNDEDGRRRGVEEGARESSTLNRGAHSRRNFFTPKCETLHNLLPSEPPVTTALRSYALLFRATVDLRSFREDLVCVLRSSEVNTTTTNNQTEGWFTKVDPPRLRWVPPNSPPPLPGALHFKPCNPPSPRLLRDARAEQTFRFRQSILFLTTKTRTASPSTPPHDLHTERQRDA